MGNKQMILCSRKQRTQVPACREREAAAVSPLLYDTLLNLLARQHLTRITMALNLPERHCIANCPTANCQLQAQELRTAGLTAYNHNLDTSPEFYGQVLF